MGKTRVVFIDPGAKVNSSNYCNIVLKEGLLPDIRAICRHYRWTLQQDGAPAHIAQTTMDYLKKSTLTSLNLTCGLQIALILISWITLFGALFSIDSTTDNSRRWNNSAVQRENLASANIMEIEFCAVFELLGFGLSYAH